jgi:hypothetical protein
MQHQLKAGAMPSQSQCYALSIAEPLAAGIRPPRMPRAAGGLSGRPTCRIYARGSVWVLEFDSPCGGWLDPVGGMYSGQKLTFASLTAAIGYADWHGLLYRIERPLQPRNARRQPRGSSSLPRSWLARLARNGRNRKSYHG